MRFTRGDKVYNSSKIVFFHGVVCGVYQRFFQQQDITFYVVETPNGNIFCCEEKDLEFAKNPVRLQITASSME
jgi:hypothetical protein